MTTFILIHGAFFGGWCWDSVSKRLEASGHSVFAPTLTGLAEKQHLLTRQTDLRCHIDDVVSAIDAVKEPRVVLVGHSYGGMPVMGAADARAERIAAMVFLDAVVPRNGETLLSIRGTVDPGGKNLQLPMADGPKIIAPSAESYGFEGDLAQQVNKRLTSHPLGTLTQPIQLSGAWNQIAVKFYVRTTLFNATYYDRICDDLGKRPGWIAAKHEKTHCVMLTDPEWLADLLMRFSGR